MTQVALDRARSFEAWAPEYDRFRPDYPDALFGRIADKLSLRACPVVADMGAGTGRATLAMAERGWRMTAVEAGGRMLEVLRARATDAGLVVTTLQADAEETGIDPSSVDLVTAAQAFHWFDKDRVMPEMARILRPGGGVALFWNVRDETRSEFVTAYHDLLERRFGNRDSSRLPKPRAPTPSAESTRAALETMSAFESVEFEILTHEIGMTAPAFVGMAFTASYVRAQDPEAQAAFRVELEDLLTRHGLTDRPFDVPYRVDLWTARRSER